MADYYPLIARAIDGLSEDSFELRQSVYERARTALTEQLRSLEPPLSEEDIRREQLSLNEAIARVEAERAPVAAPEVPAEAEAPDAGPLPPPTPLPIGRPAPAPVSEPIEEPVWEEAAPLPEEAPAVLDEPPVEIEPPRPTRPDPVVALRAPERPRPVDPPPEPYEEPERLPAPAGPVRPRVESRSPRVRSPGRGRALLLGVVLLLVVGVIGWLAWMWRDQPDAAAAQPPVADVVPAAPDGAKFNERVGGGPPTPPVNASRSEIGVAQRAVLYEEDPTNPRAPKASAGRVTWRIDAVNAGQGQPLETVVRANVEIQEAGLTMTLLIRRNLDNTLPASHTAEIAFTTKPGESGRAIRDVGLLQFKDDFSTRGTPVAGQRITLGENLFVIGLLSTDVQRNADLMKRGWIDIPILMASGQRAVLTFEKGAPGEQAMSEALRQWQ